jgi:raffinose/stachyose/melibiose transport system substrate-binding protein
MERRPGTRLMQRRLGLAAALAASLSMLAAACSSSGDASGTQAAGETLTLAAGATGGSNLPALFTLAKAFEKAYPSIKIKTETFPNQTYDAVLRTQLQGGGGPDIWWASAGTGDQASIISYGKAGLAADLAGESWAKDVPAVARSQYYYHGALYGVPMDYVPYGWVYELADYKKWGVSAPQTLSQALTVCRAAKSKGDSAYSIAGAVPSNTGATAMMLAASYVYAKTPNWDALRDAGKVTFASSPGWTQALDALVAMYKAGCFQPGATGATFNDLGRYLGSQQAGTVATPTESIATLEATAKIAVNVYPSFGSSAGDQRVYANFGNALAMNAHTHNKAAAEKFLAFAASTKGEEVYAAADDNPSYADVKAGTVSSQLDISGIVSDLRDSAKTIVWPPSNWPNEQVYSELGTGVQGLLTGQTTVPAVLKSMDAAWSSD